MPLHDITFILVIIRTLVQTLRLRRLFIAHQIQRQPVNFHPIQNIINLLRNINMIANIIRRRRTDRRKTKPHILMKMLQGYRCTMGNHDVLTILQTNWDDFYWLTGEFPPTFDLLLHHLQQIRQQRVGRRKLLDFGNQVKNF